MDVGGQGKECCFRGEGQGQGADRNRPRTESLGGLSVVTRKRDESSVGRLEGWRRVFEILLLPDSCYALVFLPCEVNTSSKVSQSGAASYSQFTPFCVHLFSIIHIKGSVLRTRRSAG